MGVFQALSAGNIEQLAMLGPARIAGDLVTGVSVMAGGGVVAILVSLTAVSVGVAGDDAGGVGLGASMQAKISMAETSRLTLLLSICTFLILMIIFSDAPALVGVIAH